MTAPILSPPAMPNPLRLPPRRNPSHPVVTCVDSSSPKIPTIDLFSYSPSPVPLIDDSFYDSPVRAGDVANDADDIWAQIRADALSDAGEEPILARYCSLILRHENLESALADLLATKLATPDLLPTAHLRNLFAGALLEDSAIRRAVRADLLAAGSRDPACCKMAHCFLHHKGFLACQAHRVAHRLWASGRRAAALLIQSRSSEIFAVDIHPAARIGAGLLLDHATGVVIGETAVVGDDVSILHGVTLGGTAKGSGDRHPKIGDGVLIGAGTQILGNLRVGEEAKVGAGSVVLKEVPARSTVVGNPARLIRRKETPVRLDQLASKTMDHASWSDYVI